MSELDCGYLDCDHGADGRCRVHRWGDGYQDRAGLTTTDSEGRLTCAACGQRVEPDHRFCPRCGQPLRLDDDSGDATNNAHSDPEIREGAGGRVPLASSSGRSPIDSSPQARRALLDRLNDQGAPLRLIRYAEGGGTDWITQVSDADRLVEQTERDVAEAAADMQYARHVIDSEHLAERSLDPDQRHEYVEFLQAEARWERAVQAAERARERLNRLLEKAPQGLSDTEPGRSRNQIFTDRAEQLADAPSRNSGSPYGRDPGPGCTFGEW